MQTNGKNSVPNAPKMAVLRYIIEKFFWAGGTVPQAFPPVGGGHPLFQWEGDTPSPPARRLRRLDSRAFGASILVPPVEAWCPSLI